MRRGDPGVPPEIVAALAEASRIGAVGHVGPDGDALGSILGLTLAARAAGKEAWASFGEPFVLAPNLSFLDRSTLVSPSELPEGLDVVVVCDTAVRDRLGSVAPRVDTARRIVVVDHHPAGDGFGDLHWVAPASATAEMVFRLVAALGWPIDEAVATALYVGIVTDTGRFQYSATTPETHRVAALLLEAGVRTELVGEKLFEEAPFGYYRVVANVLGRAVLEPDVGPVGLVWSVMYRADLDEAGIGYEETDGLIDLVRMAREAGVAALLKERDRGRFKVSLRSRGSVDVGELAARFDGGGHRNAAGFDAAGPPDEIVAKIRSALP
ncbi:MAG TPA: bifunctional oligoribonuclease/PAP phosphatase NrnA [Actinobacteria bacterium]|nr:bifunctional oligoribonuclease/PAP phosphatase NrnA [Actinomycetota bacterium]